MSSTLALPRELIGDNERIATAVAAQAPRLRAFVRRQVTDLAEVEDIVQDTFAQLVAAYRLMEPIQHVAAWLQRVVALLVNLDKRLGLERETFTAQAARVNRC